MASEIPEDVMQLLQNIAKEKGLKDIAITIAPGSNHADGFLGIISRISINGKNESDEPTELSLIVKLPPTNEIRREQFGANGAFEREILAYTKYLKIIEEFQLSKGLTAENGFFTYPKCYGTIFDAEIKNYAIVLEDLKVQKFELLDKFKTIDLDHVVLVLKEMAKMHGISYALRDQRPDDFNKFANLDDYMVINMGTEQTEQYRNMICDKAIETLDENNDAEIIIKMKSIKDDYVKHLVECSKSGYTEFAIIGHGDCWNNNMMFSYDSKNHTPKDMRFLDWQLLRPSSPVLDLVYFLFTSTHKPLRDEHYDSLLQIYYTILADTINAAGSDATKLFTFDDLQEQLKLYGKYALLMAPMLLDIITADPKDIPDIDVMAEQMANSATNVTVNSEMFGNMGKPILYNERMRDVIRDVIAYGYF